MSSVNHPLKEGTRVEALRKTCNCSGGKYVKVTGTIRKVITNHTGIWYYLDTGHTIQSAWVEKVL